MKKDETNESHPDVTKPNSSSIGAPPGEVTTTPAPPVIDTTDAAVTVATNQAAIGAQAVGVPPVFIEATEAGSVADSVLPNAAYGDFVKQVGLAVAEAQKALDKNSVEAAQLLASTKITALVALNQVIDEDGVIEAVQALTKEVDLIAYIQPTFYQWSNVTLFARFDVREFSADGHVKIGSSVNTSSSSSGFGGSLSGGFLSSFFGSGSIGGSTNRSSSSRNSTTDINTESSNALSAGTSFMQAVLEPRTDTRFPPPILAIQGPKLTLTTSPTTVPPPTPGTPGPPATPSIAPPPATITITLFKKGGFSTGNKTVDLTQEGPGTLSATSITLTSVTGDNERQRATVTLSRSVTDPPGTVTVRATLGGLTTAVSILFQ
jgi:hypothetical protein